MAVTNHKKLVSHDQILSAFIGQKKDWCNNGHDLYAALVKKQFSIETAVEDGVTTVSVTAFGFTISARHSEPFTALADAAVKSIQFHALTRTGEISLPKIDITFMLALHWLLRGLDIRRKAWPKGKYISLELGFVAHTGNLASFLPGELFQVSEDVSIPVMPRLVATDGEQQARYDWCAIGVDIMATDWEAF